MDELDMTTASRAQLVAELTRVQRERDRELAELRAAVREYVDNVEDGELYARLRELVR